MIKKWLLLSLVLAGVVLAGEKTYTITLNDPVMAGATLLKAGMYHVRLDGAKATLLEGMHAVAEANVKEQNVAKKFDRTEVEFQTIEGTSRLQLIRLAGTKLELDFN